MRGQPIPGLALVAVLLTTAAGPSLLAQQPEPPPAEELFGQAETQGPAGSGNPGGGHPQMVGDLGGGIFVRRLFTFPTTITLQVTRCTTTTGGISTTASGSPDCTTQNILVPGVITREVNVPLASRGPFKIGENESPVPVDRVYSSYNYFNNVAVLQGRADSIPGVFTQANAGAFDSSKSSFNPTDESTTTTTTTVRALGFDPAPGFDRLDVHREVIGFEKLVFSDNFSVGVRVPLIDQTGVSALESSHLGDISVILKYALINNRESGNVLSAGFMLTAPTGEEVLAADGEPIHSTLLQPFLGYFANFGQFYVHGFSSLIVPTDRRDAVLLCNDVGLGYRLYEDQTASRFVRFVSPTVEGHATNPFTREGALESPGGFPDIFVGTAAVHIGLGDRGALTLGAGLPLTGPQPFDYEGIVQFNLRF